MIEVNCQGCPLHCCGMNPQLTPVLLPSEEGKFEGKTKIVETHFRSMSLLARKETGNCIFLDEKTNRCTNYDERPLECRLFPFLLDFGENGPGVRLDTQNCPRLNTLDYNKQEIRATLKKYQFPKEWIEGYLSLTGV